MYALLFSRIARLSKSSALIPNANRAAVKNEMTFNCLLIIAYTFPCCLMTDVAVATKLETSVKSEGKINVFPSLAIFPNCSMYCSATLKLTAS